MTLLEPPQTGMQCMQAEGAKQIQTSSCPDGGLMLLGTGQSCATANQSFHKVAYSMRQAESPASGLARNRFAACSDSSLPLSALSASTSCIRFRRRSSARRLHRSGILQWACSRLHEAQVSPEIIANATSARRVVPGQVIKPYAITVERCPRQTSLADARNGLAAHHRP